MEIDAENHCSLHPEMKLQMSTVTVQQLLQLLSDFASII